MVIVSNLDTMLDISACLSLTSKVSLTQYSGDIDKSKGWGLFLFLIKNIFTKGSLKGH